MEKSNRTKITAFTTDPYDNIYGYALVFYRFFDYLQKNRPELEVSMYSNDGVCSTIIHNPSFHTVRLDKKSGLLGKSVTECAYFLRTAANQPSNTVFVVNCEIPELIVGSILTLMKRKVFCIFQDDRVRKKDFFTRFICKFRVFLLRRNKHVLFTNRYTLQNLKGPYKSYYLGNPVF